MQSVVLLHKRSDGKSGFSRCWSSSGYGARRWIPHSRLANRRRRTSSSLHRRCWIALCRQQSKSPQLETTSFDLLFIFIFIWFNFFFHLSYISRRQLRWLGETLRLFIWIYVVPLSVGFGFRFRFTELQLLCSFSISLTSLRVQKFGDWTA